MEEEDDLTLLTLWLTQSNELAFAVLYNRHLNPMLGSVERRWGAGYLVRESTRVQGAIDETWMRIRERFQGCLDEFTTHGFRQLLITILRRCIIDAYRKETGAPAPLGDHAEGVTDARQEAAMQRLEAIEEVRHWLERMPPEHREIYELRYVEELTLQQVGKRLGISTTGAHNREQRMIGWLREQMGGESDAH